eukprot:22505_1
MAEKDIKAKSLIKTDNNTISHDEKTQDLTKFKNIISIDFGSYGSVAHYCMPHSTKRIYRIKDWKGMTSLGSVLDSTMQKKTLTALLWDVKNEKVVSYGYQALKEFNDYKKYQNM